MDKAPVILPPPSPPPPDIEGDDPPMWMVVFTLGIFPIVIGGFAIMWTVI